MKFNSNKFLLIILLVAFSGVESYAHCYKTVGSRGGSSAFSLEIGAGMPVLISLTIDSKFGDIKNVDVCLCFLLEVSHVGLRGYDRVVGLSVNVAPPSTHVNI